MSSESSIVISSNISNIKDVFSWLDKTLFILINNKDKKNTISLVIQEALVNAIIHGNKEDNNKNVTLNYKIDKKDIYLQVSDEGVGISKTNQIKNKNLIKEEDLLKSSGRGIILMKHFCKSVSFKKNTIELVLEL